MTEVIRLEQASLINNMKQPAELRYALFCQEFLAGIGITCGSENTLGHLGDYRYYQIAKDNGLKHPHSVLIRFYPDYDNENPSADFQQDFIKNTQSD